CTPATVEPPVASTGTDHGSAGAGGDTAASSTSVSSGGAGGAPAAGNNGFPARWSDGSSCATEPEVMVCAYDDDTYILRQSLCTNFEGNFVYLLFGQDKAFLQDTGTGDADL